MQDDAGNQKLGNGYTSSRQRLVKNEAGVGLFWYVWGGSSVIAEYQSQTWGGDPLVWKKSYVYAGSRLLSTFTSNGSGGETLEFHHPDRLGTKVITNNTANTSFEQSTLPFGTALDAETSGTTNQRFTSYDRSTVAQLDYAVNRSYSSGQGRFTSVDPIGMGATNLGNPQSLNLYAYVENNPIDYVDPSGLDKFDDFVEGIGAAQDALMNTPTCKNFFRTQFGREGIEYLTAYVEQQRMTYGTSYDYTVVKKGRTVNETYRFESGNIGAATLMMTTTSLDFYRQDGTLTRTTAFPILINENGFFFSLRDTDGNFVNTFSEFSGFTNAEIRGSVILHELAHALGKIPSDGTSSAESKRNSERIKFFCFSAYAKNSRNSPLVTTVPATVSNEIILPGGISESSYIHNNYDPFRSYQWLLFEQWARSESGGGYGEVIGYEIK